MAIFKRLLRDKNGDIVIPAMSVSGDYYVATRVSTGQYSITSPFLPEPTDGMTIKVKFNYASSSGTPSLSINGGTYNYIRTIGSTTGTAATRTGAILSTSTIYEMTYNSSYGWIISNTHSLLKSADVDFTNFNKYIVNENQFTMTGQSVIGTLKAPASGYYLLLINASLLGGTYGDYFVARLFKDDVEIKSVGTNLATSNSGRAEITAMYVANLTTSNNIKATIEAGQEITVRGGTTFAMIRIA